MIHCGWFQQLIPVFAIQNTLADSTMFSTNQFLKILRKETYLATKYLFSHKASTIVTF